MTLATRMPSSQPATPSSGSLRACRMVRVNANDSTARPHAALLNSYSFLSGSRRPFCFWLFPPLHFGGIPTLSLFVCVCVCVCVSFKSRSYRVAMHMKINHAQKEAGIQIQQFVNMRAKLRALYKGTSHASRLERITPKHLSRLSKVTPRPLQGHERWDEASRAC